MAEVIKLRNGLVKVEDTDTPGQFNVVGGAGEITIELPDTTEELPIAGEFKQYVSAGQKEITATLQGVYFQDDDTHELFMTKKLADETIRLQFVEPRKSGSVTWEGEFVIGQVSNPIVAPTGVKNYSIGVKSTGAYTRTVV